MPTKNKNTGSASMVVAKDGIRFAMGLYGYRVTMFDDDEVLVANTGVAPLRERVMGLTVVTDEGRRFHVSASLRKRQGGEWETTQVEFQPLRGGEKIVVDFLKGFRDRWVSLYEEVRHLKNRAVVAYFDVLRQVVEDDRLLRTVVDLLDFGRIQLFLYHSQRDDRKFHEVRIPIGSTDGSGNMVCVLIGPKSWEPLYLEVQFGGELVTYEHVSSGVAWHWRRRSVIRV